MVLDGGHLTAREVLVSGPQNGTEAPLFQPSRPGYWQTNITVNTKRV